MYSNFVTPPDFVEDDYHTVLLIDPVESQVMDISLLCKSVGSDFNVYIYLDHYNNYKWLEEAFNRSDSVLINTVQNSCSQVKDKLVEHNKSYHYGPKRFFDNDRRIELPIEYFINYVKNHSTSQYADL